VVVPFPPLTEPVFGGRVPQSPRQAFLMVDALAGQRLVVRRGQFSGSFKHLVSCA
jgi:hypothetical protein